MSRRVLPLVVFALAACQSAARPRAFAVWDSFPLEYRGSFEPATPMPDGARADAELDLPRVVAVATEPSITIGVCVVELPFAEVRVLLPAWPGRQGAHVEAADLATSLAVWRDQGRVTSEASMAGSLGADMELRSVGRAAYLSHLAVVGNVGPVLVDPMIGVYEYGLELRVTPRRDGERTLLAFDWRDRDALSPQPVGKVHGGRLGSIEVPIVLDQRLCGETDVVPGATIVLGAMLGSSPDTVRLLCLDCCEVPRAAPSSVARVDSDPRAR